MPTASEIDQINEGADSPTENATEVNIAAGALLGLSSEAPSQQASGSGADNADDTTAGAGIYNGASTTNEGGAPVALTTPKPQINHLGNVSHPDTINVHLHGGPSSVSEKPTVSDGRRDVINNGGKLFNDNEEEEEEDVNDDRKVAAAEKYSTTEKEMDDEDDGEDLDEEGEVAANDTTAGEVQILTEEEQLKKLFSHLQISIISDNELQIGMKEHTLMEPITYDNIVPSEEDVNLPELKRKYVQN